MLKIKLLIVAILAVGFATNSFADGSYKQSSANAASSKAPLKGKIAVAAQKWKEIGDALKAKCNTFCVKKTCTILANAVQCAINCRKVAPEENIDCTPMAYALKCGAYAKADPAKGAKLDARKAAGDESCLTLAKANAAIMNWVYLGRDVDGSPQQEIWQKIKSVDTGNDAPEDPGQ